MLHLSSLLVAASLYDTRRKQSCKPWEVFLKDQGTIAQTDGDVNRVNMHQNYLSPAGPEACTDKSAGCGSLGFRSSLCYCTASVALPARI